MKNGPSTNLSVSIEAQVLIDSVKIGSFELPEELLLHILSYLTPHEMLRLQKTNHFFHQFAADKTLWKRHIARYFPYLKDTYANEYDENPYQLFLEEAKRCHTEETMVGIPLSLLFSALKGDIYVIENAKLSELKKEALYIRAASNGHRMALLRLGFGEKEEAFLVACRKGHLIGAQAVTSLRENMPAPYISKALLIAAGKGYLNVVNWLLTQFENRITEEDKQSFLMEAIQADRLSIFEKLLGNIYNTTYFNCAALHKSFAIATYLLERYGIKAMASHNNDTYEIRSLFVSAAKANQNRLVALLLDLWWKPSDIDPSFSRSEMRKAIEAAITNGNIPLIQMLSPHACITAFLVAVEKGHLAIAQWIYTQYNCVPHAMLKGEALYSAAQRAQSKIIIWLLEEFGTASFKRRLPTGLKWISALCVYPWMQWILHKTLSTISRGDKEDAFIIAVREGDVSTLKSLLSHIHDEISAQIKSKAINTAAGVGNLNAVEYLMEKFKATFLNKEAALKEAATYGHLPVVQFLLAQCAPENYTQHLRKKFHWSLLERLSLLPESLERKGEKMAAQIKGQILETAAHHKRWDVTTWLLCQYQNELSLDAKINALKSIIRHRNVELITSLLSMIDPELSYTQRGTLLISAAVSNNGVVVALLLERWESKIDKRDIKAAREEAVKHQSHAAITALSEDSTDEMFVSTKTYMLRRTTSRIVREEINQSEPNKPVSRATFT
jgi:hypothetical protein